MKQGQIIKKARLEISNGIKILQIKGSPYEMGYQHGYLPADKIVLMVKMTLPGTDAFVAFQTGNGFKEAQDMLWIGKRLG